MLEVLGQELARWAAEVLIALVGLACAWAVYYLNNAAKKIARDAQAATVRDATALFWDAVKRLNDVAEKTVAKFEQTIAAELRQAVKDGRADRAELLAVGRKAYEEVLATLGPAMVQVLEANLGDLRGYVEATVEAKVRELKERSAS